MVCGFLLFRPYFYQGSDLLYLHDDESYLAHATALAFFEFPNYEKEHFTAGAKMPAHSIGPGLLASPFVFAFSLLDRATNHPIIHHRSSRQTILGSWSVFGFLVSTLTYFWITCLILYRCANHFFSQKASTITILLLILVQGAPLFVFRRPIFSHVYEMFLQSILLFLFLKAQEKSHWIQSKKGALLIGFLTGLIILTRQYNIVGAFLWIGVIHCLTLHNSTFHFTRSQFAKIAISLSGLIIMVVVFKLFPAFYNHTSVEDGRYLSITLDVLLAVHSFTHYLRRLMTIFVGIDFGLLFTAPYALMSLVAIPWIKQPWKKSILILLFPLTANMFVLLQWLGQGSWYGYRYLVFSLFPILLIPTAYLIDSLLTNTKKYQKYFVFGFSIIPLLSMLCFEGSKKLTLSPMYGGWRHPTYQLAIWETVLFTPIEAAIVILKGGPLYCVYMLANFLSLEKSLPGIIFEKYPVFSAQVLVKTILIWMLPLFFLFLYQKFGNILKNSHNQEHE